MLPSPRLDDRGFDDLVAEALRRLQRYCPQWTHRGPSDPGVALIELAAWLTDLTLYRLNRVPEKHHLAFLDLLGISPRPRQAAQAVVRFHLVAGAGQQLVPAGTELATTASDDGETVLFETEHEVRVSEAPLVACWSAGGGRLGDLVEVLRGGRPDGVAVFGGLDRVERFVYLEDPRFGRCGDGTSLWLELASVTSDGRDLARSLAWERWNGERWCALERGNAERGRGEVEFRGPIASATTAVLERTGCWLRGRLDEVLAPHEDEVTSIRARLEVAGAGLLPDRAVVGLGDEALLAADLGRAVHPFGLEPRPGASFYLACEAVFAGVSTEVEIEIALVGATAPSHDLVVAWEIFDGTAWSALGRVGPRGLLPGAEPGFTDSSLGLRQAGVVRFARPARMAAHAVAGIPAHWLRARVVQGDFGVAGSYVLDGERWVFRDERPLGPPVVQEIRLRAGEAYAEVAQIVTRCGASERDLTRALGASAGCALFAGTDDEVPALYLGWDGRVPAGDHALYLQLVADDTGDPAEDEARVVWEVAGPAGWSAVPVRDGSHGLSRSGFVTFAAPSGWSPVRRFGQVACWLRARLDQGGFVAPPRLRQILANAVSARHQRTIRDEVLGGSDGLPLQRLRLLNAPVLDDEQLAVDEREPGSDAARWVPWQRVDSFYESGPDSRHYTLDHELGEVGFGDGVRGMVPPAGRANLRTTYRVGGGAIGNLAPGSLATLTRALAFIDRVDQPIAAGGGADPEAIDEAKRRAPLALRNRDRAVTAEDFEALAAAASSAVARARCLAGTRPGVVTVIVLPRAASADDHGGRVEPSPALLRRVERYLEVRKLLGTRLEVIRPRYREVALELVVRRQVGEASAAAERRLEKALRRFLHPLRGGPDGRGWPFGRAVAAAELARVADPESAGEVEEVRLFDDGREVTTGQLRLGPDELPALGRVAVVGRRREVGE